MSSSLLSNASLSLTGKVHLNEAVKMFDHDVLRELKREFGGLQTLLRNEHQVFQGVCVCGRCVYGGWLTIAFISLLRICLVHNGIQAN